MVSDETDTLKIIHHKLALVAYEQWLGGSIEDALAFQRRVFPPEFIEIERTGELWVKKKSAEPKTAILL